MLRIIIISVVCFVCTSVNGQNQNVVEKKIPHLYFPYEQVEKNSVQGRSASIIVDTDNDGVLDKFDKEINSPIGFPVDVFGISKTYSTGNTYISKIIHPSIFSFLKKIAY